MLPQPEVALHSAQKEAKGILTRKRRRVEQARAHAEASFRQKAALPKAVGPSDKREKQVKQGRADMPVPKGFAGAEGPKRRQEIKPGKPWLFSCIVLGRLQKHNPADCKTFRKMSSRQRLTKVQDRKLCKLCFRHLEARACKPKGQQDRGSSATAAGGEEQHAAGGSVANY
jgi:hypothetical protein